MKPAWRKPPVSKSKPAVPQLKDHAWLVDTHCHLDMEAYREDLGEVIQRAFDHGVRGIVSIGIDLTSSNAAISIARKYRSVRAAVGVHPHDAAHSGLGVSQSLARLIEENREEVVAIGEIGLDYVKQYADPLTQRRAFVEQLGLARELGLPVIIHDREAHEECLKLLRSEGPFERGGIMHCFSGNLDFARQVADCNFLISIPGIVTFKNAADLRQVAIEMPLDQLLVETDGPFLAPEPYRGKRNEPLYTLYTAAAIANLRQTNIDEVAIRTSTNVTRLFGYDFGKQSVCK